MSDNNTPDYDAEMVNWEVAASRMSRGMDVARGLGEKDLEGLIALMGLTSFTSRNARAVVIAMTGADMEG